MPNHVYNSIVVTGEQADITKFKQECFVEQERELSIGDVTQTVKDYHFDFNRFIPMPDEIRDTEVSSTVTSFESLIELPRDQQIQLTGDNLIRMAENLADNFKIPHSATVGELLDAIEQYTGDDNTCVSMKQSLQNTLTQKENKTKYGTSNWYDWATANWGTKWNAYETDIDDYPNDANVLVFRFTTAWAMPIPIFSAMATLYPTLDFEIESVEEMGHFAYNISFDDDNQIIIEDMSDADKQAWFGEPDELDSTDVIINKTDEPMPGEPLASEPTENA